MNITNLVQWACKEKNENILKECIQMKYNVNENTLLNCYSPLMIAAEQPNNLNIIKLLVNNGADLNHVNDLGKCVLEVASDKEYLLFLQSNGATNSTPNMFKYAMQAVMTNAWYFTVLSQDTVNQVDAQGLTPFLWAIKEKRPWYINKYIQLGANVNQAGKTGITPLMMALIKENFSLVKCLVYNGANVNEFDNNGLPVIAYFNLSYNPINIFDYLIQNGAKIDPCMSGNGKSPLLIAAIQNDNTNFDYFLNKNANVNFIDNDGNSVLSYAILNGNINNAQKLIAKGANINACGSNGKPPITWSVFLNIPAITQFLLDNGAKINKTDHQKWTALDYAEKYQYLDIAKLLKSNGAKTTIAQHQNIFAAIQAKDINSIKQLLKNFNVYDKNVENETVADVAIQVGDLDIIKLMLEKDKDLFVNSALPTAIQNKNIQVVKLLLENGANVNRISKKTKQSPLIQAINQQNEDIVKLLLQFNANIKTNEDPSPFQRVLQLIGHDNIIKMVTEKVVDANEQENGKSYLQMAVEENNINVIMLLLKKGADPRNELRRLKELAEEYDELDILLNKILVNFNEETSERKTNKTDSKSEGKSNKTELKWHSPGIQKV